MNETGTGVELVMIVKDEYDMLPDCLESVRAVVDRMLIVDTGSTDGTQALARSFGAEVIEHPWGDSFAEARNFALANCQSRWALLLDADERLLTEDTGKLLEFVRTSDLDGAHFSVLNKVGQGGQIALHNALRLLRNTGEYHYVGDIHEQIERKDGRPVGDRFALTDIRLLHLGYLDSVANARGKRLRNLPLIEKALRENPDDPFSLFNLGNEYMAQRDLPAALSAYEQALQHSEPTRAYAPHLMYRRALCLMQLGKLPEAITALSQALQLYPSCTDLELARGEAYLCARRDTMAIDSFERAIEMGEPPLTLRFTPGAGTVRPMLHLAAIYERHADWGRAAMWYARAASTEGGMAAALYPMTRCLKAAGLSPSDVAARLEELFADPTYSPNRLVLIDALFKARLSEEAYRRMEALTAEREAYVSDWALLEVESLFHRGDPIGAATLAEELMRKHEPPKVLAGAFRDAAILWLAVQVIVRGRGTSAATSPAVVDGSGPQESDQEVWDLVNECLRHDVGAGAVAGAEALRHTLEGMVHGEVARADSDGALWLITQVLAQVLTVGAFERFEAMLQVLNHVDSPAVLVALAGVYAELGFDDMAARTLMQSVEQLHYMDLDGARLLLRTIPPDGLHNEP